MKNLVKNIVLMLTALFLISMAVSCKKEDPAPAVNFNNPTAQYIESFLGKSVDEFIKACEECGMMKIKEEKDYISYSNEINKIETDCYFKNNVLTGIEYLTEPSNKKEKFIEYFNYLSNNNYAAFKGDCNGVCYKDINEFGKNLANSETAYCYMAKASNAVYVTTMSEKIIIGFYSPESEMYEIIKSYAMSSCN